MGILGDLIDNWAVRRTAKAFREIESWQPGGLEEPQSKLFNTKTYLKASQMITWTGVCCSHIGEDVANSVYGIYNEKDRPVESEELAALLSRPNPFMTGGELLEMMAWFYLLAGNVYILKAPKNRYQELAGIPGELWLLNPAITAPMIDKDAHVPTGYSIKVGLHEIRLKPEDVVHIKAPNPLNAYVGMGKIQYNETMFNTEIAAQHYNWMFFEQGGQPAVALTSQGDIRPEQKKELEERFKRYQGYKKAHRMMILSGGMDIKTVGLSQKDMAFTELRKFTREEILSIFKVPPSVAGIFEYANYANAEIQERQYWKQAIAPLLRKFAEALTAGIVKTFDERWELAFDDVVKADEKQNMQLARDGIATAVLTPNEARKMYIGLEEVDAPGMDDLYLPLNLMPISMAGEPPLTEKSAEKSVKARTGRRLQLAILRMARNVRRKAGRAIKKDMEEYFGEQERELGAVLGEEEGRSAKADEPVSSAEADRIVQRIRERVFGRAADGKIKSTIRKGHTSVMINAIEDLNEVMGTEVDPSTSNPGVTARIGRLGRRITRVNDTTRDAVERQVKDGVDAGESIAKIKARVEGVMRQARSYRAEMIARTESAAAYDQGAMLSYKEAGIKYVSVVGCSGDDDYPETNCNRQHIPIDEADGLEFHPSHIGCIVPEL